jgi:hypothetical protein
MYCCNKNIIISRWCINCSGDTPEKEKEGGTRVRNN